MSEQLEIFQVFNSVFTELKIATPQLNKFSWVSIQLLKCWCILFIPRNASKKLAPSVAPYRAKEGRVNNTPTIGPLKDQWWMSVALIVSLRVNPKIPFFSRPKRLGTGDASLLYYVKFI